MSSARVSLYSRLNRLRGPNEVLDVSRIHPDGTGITLRTRSPRSLGVPGLPIVSNNYPSYATAMRLLGPRFEPYADEYLRLHGAGEAIEESSYSADPSPFNVKGYFSETPTFSVVQQYTLPYLDVSSYSQMNERVSDIREHDPQRTDDEGPYSSTELRHIARSLGISLNDVMTRYTNEY